MLHHSAGVFLCRSETHLSGELITGNKSFFLDGGDYLVFRE
ncbi:hypothetical protein [Selenomonas ruminantium]|nr:hypothetical protein [Selenomonas ruminantium]